MKLKLKLKLSFVAPAVVLLVILLSGGVRCSAKKSAAAVAPSARAEGSLSPQEGQSTPAPATAESNPVVEEGGHVLSGGPAAMSAGETASSAKLPAPVVKADRVAPRSDPAATGKATTGPEAARLLPRPRKGKKGRKERQNKPRELKKVDTSKRKAKAGQEGKRRVQISQSGRARKPHPKPIEDIAAYRGEPLEFITRFKDRRVLDLEKADFDAEVIAVVDGRKITKNAFRMDIVDSLGALTVDRFLTAILTERMKKKLVAEGADPARFEVSEKAVDNEINNQMMMAKQQDRSGQFKAEAWKKLIDQSLGWENYREMQRSVLAFGKVYLPEIAPKKPEKKEGERGAEKGGKTGEQALDSSLPSGKDSQGKTVNIYMPIHTWKALGRDESSRHIRDSLNTAYRDGTPLGAFIRPQYIRTVKDAVVKGVKVEYHSSAALPEGVYMRVGDRDVALDEIYPIVAATLTRDDLKQVLSEMLVYEAMDKILDEGGWTLSEEEFEKAFADYEKQYEGTLFPLAFIMNMHGYYLKEDFKKMYRRRLAYAKMLTAQKGMTDEVLKNFFEKGARLFYQNGGVKIQSIFFGVYDHKAMKVRENGYAWARGKMAEALAQLKAGTDFLEVAKKYEDINGFHRPAETDYMTRNDFRYSFGEKTKNILASGYCLADDCFYNAVPGDVIGPLEVTYSEFGNPVFKGEYLVKVIGFRTMLDLNPFEQSKPTIKEDYLDLNFLNWAARTLAKADVEITRKK